MLQNKVASRYAKALFQLAVETSKVEEVRNDLMLVRDINHKELSSLLVSPVVAGEKKVSIFDAIFSKHIQSLTASFFKLIFSKGRSIAIYSIIDAFEEMYRAHKGIKLVELTTAIPASEAVKDNVRKILSQNKMLLGKTIEFKEKTDASIIGGLVVQVDDKLFDASIKHDLQFIKRQFIKNMYIKDL
ncbi:MAG: ATP synthase F1 subunit delta [bacterium]|jgi:F-type H+-transporting ATPase subunit delta